jgi:hypothetical protein
MTVLCKHRDEPWSSRKQDIHKDILYHGVRSSRLRDAITADDFKAIPVTGHGGP